MYPGHLGPRYRSDQVAPPPMSGKLVYPKEYSILGITFVGSEVMLGYGMIREPTPNVRNVLIESHI